MTMLKNFRSYHFALELYRDCETCEVRSHLKDQLLRSSLSVVLNLAEGSARATLKDRLRFYNIAFASLRETQVILQVIGREDLFAKADALGGGLYRLANQPVI